MKLAAELHALSARIGYEFKNPTFLIEAMTHASLSTPTRSDNQRLEFLGDRVLGLVIAEALLSQDVNATEGLIAPRLNALVRKEACADIAQEIGLGQALKMGRSEMLSGGRRKMAVLGDAMEALIAAVYRDSDFETAREFVLRLWSKKLAGASTVQQDAKTALQEWAQARRLAPPTYAEVGRSGPDHAPVFEIEAQLETGQTARSSAPNKRQAQQEAAQKLLTTLKGQK